MEKFNRKKFIKFLQGVVDKDYSRNRAEDIALNFFESADFGKSMFAPEYSKDYTKADDLDWQKQLYSLCGTKSVMDVFAGAVDFRGPSYFNRNVSAFLYSIVYRNVLANRDRAAEAQEILDSAVTTSDRMRAHRILDDVEDYEDSCESLMHVTMKIVKKSAKELMRDCNIPKNLAYNILCYAPEPNLIEAYQVNHYANTLMKGLYRSMLDEPIDVSRVRWTPIVETYVGKRNVVDFATSVLLDGMSNTKEFKDEHGDLNEDVEACWTELTDWALQVIERSSPEVQDHMLDIYGKRLTNMVRNGNKDMRVDLRKLDSSRFPELCHAVSKVITKFNEILNETSSPEPIKIAEKEPEVAPDGSNYVALD